MNINHYVEANLNSKSGKHQLYFYITKISLFWMKHWDFTSIKTFYKTNHKKLLMKKYNNLTAGAWFEPT